MTPDPKWPHHIDFDNLGSNPFLYLLDLKLLLALLLFSLLELLVL
jgi:hypothetical protein